MHLPTVMDDASSSLLNENKAFLPWVASVSIFLSATGKAANREVGAVAWCPVAVAMVKEPRCL